LKFYNIDYHLFWYDEVATIQHTSGNQILDLPENQIKNISYYTDQLHLKNNNFTIGSELKGLYSSTNLNPLHYTFLMFWYRIAGDSEISYRFFNVFIFLLSLPLLFLLARRLFRSNLAGWIAISLFAVSPFFHYYVHEARYNTFLIFIIIILHYIFLQAIEHKKLRWWIGYSFVGILALYASALSVLILFGHFIYFIIFEKEKRITFIVTLIVIFAAYLPWIISLLTNSEEITGAFVWQKSIAQNKNFLELLLYQSMGYSHIFLSLTDIGKIINSIMLEDFKGNYVHLISDIIILIFILSSIIYTVKKAPGKTSFFLLLIIIPLFLFFLISDLIRNAGGSLVWRYHALAFIGVLLFVVYILDRKITLGKLFYSSIYVGLILAGIISSIIISKTQFYYGTGGASKLKEAQLFSDTRNPLLITDYTFPHPTRGVEEFAVILNICESDSIDILRASDGIKDLDNMLSGTNYSDIYVTHASKKLLENLKIQFGEKMKKVEVGGIRNMWQIELHP